MITSKQRSYLRGLSNALPSIFQLGKEGINENFIKQIDDALEARELIKVKVLENSGLDSREASDIICTELKCEGVQAIGSKFVIYRRSRTKSKIELV
ncbi:MAG: ribosome assembly RNA-binding protein YhbY [Clostridiaceae bacterium]|nr:ribosome assembly RNA-binding protein YhbY [Clostridiaceae bacterium]